MRLVYEPLTDIPVGFQEVEYLGSSTHQYIDTGWHPSSNNLRVKFKAKSLGSPHRTAVCGAEKIVTPRWVFILYGQSSDTTKMFPLTGTWNNSAEGFTFTNGTTLEIDWTTSATSTTITDSVSNTTYTNTFSSTVDYRNNDTTFKLFQNGDAQKASVQIYYFKIWDDGVLVRDFVPCLDNNNVPCMYDKVGGKAYYNVGTDVFSVGKKIIPVKYLESDGTQYIDSVFVPTNKTRWEFDYQFMQYSTTYKGSGMYRENPTERFSIGALGTYNMSYGANNNTSVTADTNRHKFIIDAKNMYWQIDNTTGTYSTAVTTSLPYSIYFFARNAVGVRYNIHSGRLYGSKIYDNGELVRDFIACKDENNVGYLFDKVSHSLYANAGTGSFIVGEELPIKKLRLIMDSKRRLPKGFKEVEYLQSTGTQYIDTGYAANANTIVEYNFNLVEVPTSSAFFGSGSSNTSTDRFQGYYESSLSFSTKLASTTTYSDVTLTAGTKHYSKMGIPLAGYYIDNTFIASATGIPTSLNLYVFARNINGSMQAPIKMKLYNFKISENNSLVRDFVPCLDNNNVPCMYDLVENKAYYNAGTGSFIVGDELKDITRFLEGE